MNTENIVYVKMLYFGIKIIFIFQESRIYFLT